MSKKHHSRDDRKPTPASRRSAKDDDSSPGRETSSLRVIGGSLRGRKIAYHGDIRTRPMKDRTREAIYNLIGAELAGNLAVDLFAGTGALGIEALSRGAAAAVFFEKHFPTADLIGRTLAGLGLKDRSQVFAGDTFLHLRRMRRDGTTLDRTMPWTIFCSPPYDFYVDRAAEVSALLDDLLELAPPGSCLVVEADRRFDVATLPNPDRWRVKEYAPAVVAIYRDSTPRSPSPSSTTDAPPTAD